MDKGAYLITGAAGFIGARFVESCNRRGIPVISVDTAGFFQARPEHRGLDFGTIIDRDELPALQGKRSAPLDSIQAIVHLGACTDTTEMDESLLRRLNIEYSQVLWKFAADRSVPLVYASSAATYGDGALGYDDHESNLRQLKPLNPYGESKRLFDLWALEQEALGVSPPSWAAFKFFNVYGFGERHKGKMASVVLHAYDQIRASGKVTLFRSHRDGIADGHQKRDFVFVDDVVKVLHFALEKPIPRGIFNLGTGHARTFLDLARAVFRELGVPERIEFIDTPVSIRDKYQYFTEARMERLLAAGYSAPFASLEEGVAGYVDRLEKG